MVFKKNFLYPSAFGNRKGILKKMPFCIFGSISHCDDLFFVVCSAGLADSVRKHQLAAFAALNESRSRHFPVCSSLISSRLGAFIFWTDRHGYTSLKLLKISRIFAILGSKSVRSQSHEPSFRFCPQVLQRPLQSGRQSVRSGQINNASS